MAREHAATPRRNTGGEGDEGKARSSTNTWKKHQSREKHRHGPHTGRRLHTSPHTQTPSQCRQSAGERIRPSTQQAHTPPAATRHGRGEETQRHHRLQFNPTANGIRPQPRSQHTAQKEQAITHRATRRSDSSSIYDAAPHSMRSHRVHHFLNTNYSAIPLRCFC
ncbi:hypothetical protein TcCL_Unassigned00485 [Trypanosoma cruzi]|nr:hypothetical protein TcCL_Unassigned00485 [Trypanosoma cruzi]